jgi:hypothetical protein
MPHIKIQNPTFPDNTDTEKLIHYAIQSGRVSDYLKQDENPSHITIVYGNTATEVVSKIDEAASDLKVYGLQSASIISNIIVVFYGKKSADDQRAMVCRSAYLREKSISYERIGKNKGGEHYHTYRVKEVVKPMED